MNLYTPRPALDSTSISSNTIVPRNRRFQTMTSCNFRQSMVLGMLHYTCLRNADTVIVLPIFRARTGHNAADSEVHIVTSLEKFTSGNLYSILHLVLAVSPVCD